MTIPEGFVDAVLNSRISVVAGTVRTGKSTALSACGLKAMAKGKNVLFCFQENVPHHFLSNLEDVKRAHPRSFCSVQEGMLKSTEDLEAILRSQKESLQPSLVVVDCYRFFNPALPSLFTPLANLFMSFNVPLLVGLQLSRTFLPEKSPVPDVAFDPLCDNLLLMPEEVWHENLTI
jgi:thymidine kinase